MEAIQRYYLDSLIIEFQGLEDEELAYLINGLIELRIKQAIKQAIEAFEDKTDRELQYFIASEYRELEQRTS